MIVTIDVTKVSESKMLTDYKESERLYDAIRDNFKKGHSVKLDFSNVILMTGSFLEGVFTCLYLDYDHDFMRKKLSGKGCDNYRKKTVRRALQNAREWSCLRNGYQQRVWKRETKL